MDTSETFWERTYAGRDPSSRDDGSALLVELAGDRAPGRALELGCGEGADALWLARRGWTVTAVDVAQTALDRGAARAAAAGLGDRVTFEHHDISASLPDGPFDLVAAMHLQSPVDFPRDRALGDAAALLAPGGLLLVVDHASSAPWSWVQRPDEEWRSARELLADLALTGAWDEVRVEVAAREATGPGGATATVKDAVVAVRRT